MILVDTSIWIDHLHARQPHLIALLEEDEVGIHPLVVQELAVGSLANRRTILELLDALRPCPVLSHPELLTFIERHRLWGRGLSATDVHLLGSVAITPGAHLWTRDRRLRESGAGIGVPLVTE